MIIVTGGAGFIGSNLVKGLNLIGRNDIMVVDDLTDGSKYKNLVDCQIADYMDMNDFRQLLQDPESLRDANIEVIFHQGACSDTTEWDGKKMMDINYEYTKEVLHFCQDLAIPLIYASSAAVYGANQTFVEAIENENPLNVYGYSKFLFDQYLRQNMSDLVAPVVGLRYFNVYGPREQHKGKMASVAYHLNQQLLNGDEIKLFEGCDGYDDGGQLRDFVYVDDVVAVNLWCWSSGVSGIFNVGTGKAQTFNDVAKSVLKWHERGKLVYTPFPEHLKGHYQSFTQADISALRKAGYDKPMRTVEEGVASYMRWLQG